MDKTEMLLIGAGAIYLLSKSGTQGTIQNVNKIVDTATTSTNNITSAASFLFDLSTAQFTGKNPFTPEVPSFFSSEYWNSYIPSQINADISLVKGWFT